MLLERHPLPNYPAATAPVLGASNSKGKMRTSPCAQPGLKLKSLRRTATSTVQHKDRWFSLRTVPAVQGRLVPGLVLMTT